MITELFGIYFINASDLIVWFIWVSTINQSRSVTECSYIFFVIWVDTLMTTWLSFVASLLRVLTTWNQFQILLGALSTCHFCLGISFPIFNCSVNMKLIILWQFLWQIFTIFSTIGMGLTLSTCAESYFVLCHWSPWKFCIIENKEIIDVILKSKETKELWIKCCMSQH